MSIAANNYMEYKDNFVARLEAAGVSPLISDGLFAWLHRDERTPEQADEEAAAMCVVVWGASLPSVEEALEKWRGVEEGVEAGLVDAGIVPDGPAAASEDRDAFFERELQAKLVVEKMLDKYPLYKYLHWDTNGVWFADENGNAGVVTWPGGGGE